MLQREIAEAWPAQGKTKGWRQSTIHLADQKDYQSLTLK